MNSPDVPGTETGNLHTLFNFIEQLCEAGVSLLSFLSPFCKQVLSNYHVSDSGYLVLEKDQASRPQTNGSKLNEHASTSLVILEKVPLWWHLLSLVLDHRGLCIFCAETEP